MPHLRLVHVRRDMAAGATIPAARKDAPGSRAQYYGGPEDVYAALAPKPMRQWRTPPLWGAADSAPYLHDGCAPTLDDAVLQHDGEATRAKKRYAALTIKCREQLLAYIESLGHPLPQRELSIGVASFPAGMKRNEPPKLARGLNGFDIRTPVVIWRHRAMEIRPFLESDEGAVVELWRDVFAPTAPHNDPAQVILHKMAVQRELFFVAHVDGQLVGTIMGGYDGHRGWLYSLAVHPQVRRRGIGTALMERAERELAKAGCPKVNLQVVSSNSGVVSLYQRLGYAVEDRISMGKLLD